MEKRKINFEIQVEMPLCYNIGSNVDLSVKFNREIEEEIIRFVNSKFNMDNIQNDLEQGNFLENLSVINWNTLKDYDLLFKIKQIDRLIPNLKN